jgi:hypothetical protein
LTILVKAAGDPAVLRRDAGRFDGEGIEGHDAVLWAGGEPVGRSAGSL